MKFTWRSMIQCRSLPFRSANHSAKASTAKVEKKAEIRAQYWDVLERRTLLSVATATPVYRHHASALMAHPTVKIAYQATGTLRGSARRVSSPLGVGTVRPAVSASPNG